MARKPIEVGGRVFDSKKALTEAVREILYAYSPGSALVADDSLFVSDLLEHHTESDAKIGVGVAEITVEGALHGTRCFWITRTDGSRTDFSFVNCINGKAPLADLWNAMRHDVADQVRAVRDAAFAGRTVIVCPVSGVPVTTASAHVDHAAPNTFRALSRAFIAGCGIEPEKIEILGSGDGEMLASIADAGLRAAWAEYHRERAALRVVSIDANLSTLRKGAR